MVVILTTIEIAPKLSTFTMTGSLTRISMLHNNWIMNVISFTASKRAIHLVSELNRVMFLCAFNHQGIGSPNKKIKTFMLLHVTGSPA